MPRIRQVGFAIVRVAAALGYVAMAAACLPFGYDCNDVGCRDGAAISARGVSVADGGMGEHLFFIELDGRSACCVLTRETKDWVASAVCDPGLELSTAPEYQARPIDAPCCATSLPPLLGYSWQLHIDAHPATVRVRHVRRQGGEDRVVSDGTVALSYTKSEPNGERCGPTCHSAVATMP